MTSTVPSTEQINRPATGTTDERLDEVFAPIFDRIAEGAVQREDDRRLAYDEVAWLRKAKFGALRVPVEFGGYGASIRQLFRLLIELAAAESNLPQALRVHWSFVEDQLAALPDEAAQQWLRKVGEGTLVGNAITEPGVGAIDRYQTRLTPDPASTDGSGFRLDGTKYYSTGSLYSDHILVAADQDGERVSVLVDATPPAWDRAAGR